MLNKKTILAAPAMAIVTLAGGAAANAAPWNGHHDGRVYHGARYDHRAYVDRVRIADNLRFHRYRVIGNPYWVRDRYVVRSHNRFGRTVFVQVDPWRGTFIREVVL